MEYTFRKKEKKYPPPSLPLSKDEVLNDIGHILSIGNLILGANSVKVSYLIQYDRLLQNAIDVITKRDRRQKLITKLVRFFITKCDKFIKKCNCYYKMQQFYYKI